VILLNPGPVNVSMRVRRAMLEGELCHREPEYAEMQTEVRHRLRELFAPGHEAILLTGSGTAAVEAAISSCVPPRGKLLVLVNGVYGRRMAEIARAYGIGVVERRGAWDEPLEPEACDCDLVAMVHHETTMGLLNRYRDAGVPVLLDAVSSIGGEPLPPADIVVGTANKCLQGVPGVSFVLAKGEHLGHPPRNYYLHLARYREGVPFTPAVPAVAALREALRELAEETVEGRIARYRRAGELLRRGFERLGLEFLVKPEHRSNTLTALRLPMDYDVLHDRLKSEGFVIYRGLVEGIFRVAHMGWIPTAELERFLGVLEEIVCARSS
jgi:2-aminoethylphosphonate-pyruvate transaminase